MSWHNLGKINSCIVTCGSVYSRAVAAGTVDPVSTGELLREPFDNDNYCAHAARGKPPFLLTLGD